MIKKKQDSNHLKIIIVMYVVRFKLLHNKIMKRQYGRSFLQINSFSVQFRFHQILSNFCLRITKFCIPSCVVELNKLNPNSPEWKPCLKLREKAGGEKFAPTQGE